MDYLNLLIRTVNALRSRGLSRQAASLDHFIYRHAQELGDLGDLGDLDLGGGEEKPKDEATSTETAPVTEKVSPELEALQRTLYHMFCQWQQVLDRELPTFEYFGRDNIEAMRSQLANTRKAFDSAMERRGADFDKAELDKFNGEVSQRVQQMHASQRAPVDSTKAKVDAFLVYRPTVDLYNKFLRLCKDDSTFSNVLKEFSSLVHVFANVMKNSAEDIAKVDLTEER